MNGSFVKVIAIAMVTMGVALVILLILFMALSFHASARSPYYLNEREREGGDVLAFRRDFRRYHRAGRRIVIRGRCQSACTIGLSYPNVCVMPGATLCFHMALGTSRDYWSNDVNPLGTGILSSAVPPELRGRLLPLRRDYQCVPASALPRRYRCKR